jgi:ribosomal protein S18 acetylase RimI-like enzyme
MEPMMIEICEYNDNYREDIRRICFQTGFHGKSLEEIIDYKDLFIDLSTHYFLDAGTSHIYVAKDGQKIVGYVMVIPDTKKYKRSSFIYYIYRVFLDVVRLRLFGKKERDFYVRLMIYYLKGELTLPEFDEYPSLLHINVAPGYQGQGIGGKLFEAMFDCLRKLGCPGVQLQTTSANEKSVGFFKRYGFEELASKKTSFYKPFGYPAVQTIVMGKKLCEKIGDSV